MNKLYQKIYGCEAAAAIANSMGDVTEGMTYQQIDGKYGLLTELLPQDKPERHRTQEWGPDFHYKAHHRPAGMTEELPRVYRRWNIGGAFWNRGFAD